MLRAKQLGSVVFDNPNTLFIQEQYSSNSVEGSFYMSAEGTHIAFEAAIHTPYITLDSNQYGILTEAQRDTLMTMWNTLDTTYTLTYDDDTTETVRMAKEKSIAFSPLWEGSCEFRAVIPLAKV